jgi:hypothetical protein
MVITETDASNRMLVSWKDGNEISGSLQRHRKYWLVSDYQLLKISVL